MSSSLFSVRNAALAAATAIGFSLAAAGAASAAACNSFAFGAGSFPCVVSAGHVYDFAPAGPTNNYTVANPANDSGADGESNVEKTVHYLTGTFTDLTSIQTDITGDTLLFDFAPNTLTSSGSFSWSLIGDIGDFDLAYLTVKSGTNFAIFDINGLTDGSASLAGLIETCNRNGCSPKSVSHVSFWGVASEPELDPTPDPGPDPRLSVPEPMSLALLGGGLLGLGLTARRRRLA